MILKKYIFGYIIREKKLYLFISEIYLIGVLNILKNNHISGLSLLLDIVVIDMFSLVTKYRFVLNYILLNPVTSIRVFIKILIKDQIAVRSIISLYKSSDWLEREVWDMFGIRFLFHGNLRRILTDYDFKGFALRKDFPLLGYMEVFYNEVSQGVLVNVVEMLQAFRFYEFGNPWNNLQQIEKKE